MNSDNNAFLRILFKILKDASQETLTKQKHKKRGSKVVGSVEAVSFEAFHECRMSSRVWEKNQNSVARVIPQSKLYGIVTVEESSLNLNLFTQRHVGNLSPIENLWLALQRAVHALSPCNLNELLLFCTDEWSKITVSL